MFDEPIDFDQIIEDKYPNPAEIIDKGDN